MTAFLAIVFVCATATPVPDCDDATALDRRIVAVRNELGCTMGWQEIMARAQAGEPQADGTYLKTACRRQRTPG